MNLKSKGGMLAWVLQAISGALLVGTIALHWIAQHVAVDGGLMDYSQVVNYLRQPWVMVLESSFLIVVSAHALLGLRAILMDFGLFQPIERLINLGLGLAGVGIVVYGIELSLRLVH